MKYSFVIDNDFEIQFGITDTVIINLTISDEIFKKLLFIDNDKIGLLFNQINISLDWYIEKNFFVKNIIYTKFSSLNSIMGIKKNLENNKPIFISNELTIITSIVIKNKDLLKILTHIDNIANEYINIFNKLIDEWYFN